MAHIPVLLQEVLEYLDVKQGTRFIDCTVGSGGHALAILKANPQAKILGIDLDQASLDNLQKEVTRMGLDQRIKLIQGSYKDIDKLVDENFSAPDGVLIDLGFSSQQVDDASRGFSFQTSGPLDMRFDQSSRLTAAEAVNRYPADKLEKILSEFGEEKFSRRISLAIVKQRQISWIETTVQLAEIVRTALPASVRFRANDNLRRVFQAIRIEVNAELANLRTVLPKSLQLLSPGGRLAVISFHSLEDRIVKEFFNQEASDCVCPPDFPTCVCDKVSTIRILTRKPVTALASEIKVNPRSKPAKLRACEKLI